jgi:hypothetical protein
MPLVATTRESPEHHPFSDTPLTGLPSDAEYGPTIFGIVAGGISGTIVGFFIADSFYAAMAAATGVVVGLVMGCYGTRLTEDR